MAYKYFNDKKMGKFNLIVMDCFGSQLYHYRDFVIDERYTEMIMETSEAADPFWGKIVFTIPSEIVENQISNYDYNIGDYMIDLLEKNKVYLVMAEYEFQTNSKNNRKTRQWKQYIQSLNRHIEKDSDKMHHQFVDEYETLIIAKNEKQFIIESKSEEEFIEIID
ncbi:hypothetical protein OXYTRIMIC_014 [Oxytricha trifallax]|uniref:Uncharacterized protein n=1 Tax=Oxytricha trifallax TaxID=1172189 RepID=A0A073ICN7_9SPIT|nr:hypothetical protein OXYTRIMIC_014 [Oxytricha trifallax]